MMTANNTPLQVWSEERALDAFVAQLPDYVLMRADDRLAGFTSLLPGAKIGAATPAATRFVQPDTSRPFVRMLLSAVRSASKAEFEAAVKVYCRTQVDAGVKPCKAARSLLDFRALLQLAGPLIKVDFRPAFAPIDDSGPVAGVELDDIIADTTEPRRHNQLQDFCVRLLAQRHGILTEELVRLNVEDVRSAGVMLQTEAWLGPQLYPLGPQAARALDHLMRYRGEDKAVSVFVTNTLGLGLSSFQTDADERALRANHDQIAAVAVRWR